MRLLAALLVLTLAMPASAGMSRVEANAHSHSLRVEFLDGGHCTATKIGRSELLIAAHCVSEETEQVILGMTPVDVTKVVMGPGDTARLTLDGTFSKWAIIGDPPKQGDAIFIFGNPGNPGDHRDQLRRGYISGERNDGALLAHMPIWKGDSGAAVFNERGQVVALVSAITGNEYYSVAVLERVTR